MERGSRTRLLTAVVITAVFASGVLVGFAADSNLGAEPPDEPVEVVAEEAPEEERNPPLYVQMGPTPDQRSQIDSIVAVHRERTNALDKETRSAYRQGFRQILIETRQAISEVFPPAKGAEYLQRLDEYDARQAAEREARDNQN